MVRVRIKQPSLRAVIGASARLKKIQMCPPLRDRERSNATLAGMSGYTTYAMRR